MIAGFSCYQAHQTWPLHDQEPPTTLKSKGNEGRVLTRALIYGILYEYEDLAVIDD